MQTFCTKNATLFCGLLNVCSLEKNFGQKCGKTETTGRMMLEWILEK